MFASLHLKVDRAPTNTLDEKMSLLECGASCPPGFRGSHGQTLISLHVDEGRSHGKTQCV